MQKEQKEYKKTHSLEDRVERSTKMRREFPNMVPVILAPTAQSKLIYLNRVTYIVNEALTVNEFKTQIRNRLMLGERESLFFMCGGKMISDEMIMLDVYQVNKDTDDQLLYMSYSGVETSGQ